MDNEFSPKQTDERHQSIAITNSLLLNALHQLASTSYWIKWDSLLSIFLHFVTLNNKMPSHRTNCWFSLPAMHVLDEPIFGRKIAKTFGFDLESNNTNNMPSIVPQLRSREGKKYTNLTSIFER